MLKRTLAFTLAAIMLFTVSAFAAPTATATAFSKSGTEGDTIIFTAADFEDHFTVTEDETATLESITITNLPDPDKGVLWLDDTAAEDDTAITNYEDLKLVPAADITGDITFSWKGTSSTALTSDEAVVTITLTAAATPEATATDFSKSAEEGQTIVFTAADFEDNFSVTGSTDTDLDTITITDLPDNDKGHLWVGDVKLSDETAVSDYANLKFIPLVDITGNVEFSWKGKNASGLTSNEATVSITITAAAPPPPPASIYADMTTHWAATSANKLADLGIVVGEKIGNKHYFRPDVNATRGEFLLFVAAALGIEPSSIDVPYFSDNVPAYLINLSNAFHDKGIINGVPMGDEKYALNAGQPLTRIEAFKIINGALELESSTNEDLSGYKDIDKVPPWGLQALKNLIAYEIAQGTDDGYIEPNTPLTRGQTAELVNKAYAEKNKA